MQKPKETIELVTQKNIFDYEYIANIYTLPNMASISFAAWNR